MDTLDRSQRHARRRTLCIKQPASRKALHDRKAHIVLLAEPVKLCPLFINAAQGLIVLLGKVCIHILRRRKQIEGRIDAEQHHFHDPQLHRLFRHPGVMVLRPI